VRLLRVAVVHPEALVAEALASALGVLPHLAPIGIATSRTAARSLLGAADVVVVDERLPYADDVAAEAFRAGARVVVIGDAPPDDEDVGVRVPTGASVMTLAAALAPQVAVARPSSLSERQRAVLRLAARGLTAREIARELSISVKTVEQHKTRIFEKLRVPNQAAAVRVAFAAGLEGSVA
jgi:DNA-binding NarL/FixJ family response regulator